MLIMIMPVILLLLPVLLLIPLGLMLGRMLLTPLSIILLRVLLHLMLLILLLPGLLLILLLGILLILNSAFKLPTKWKANHLPERKRGEQLSEQEGADTIIYIIIGINEVALLDMHKHSIRRIWGFIWKSSLKPRYLCQGIEGRGKKRLFWPFHAINKYPVKFPKQPFSSDFSMGLSEVSMWLYDNVRNIHSLRDLSFEHPFLSRQRVVKAARFPWLIFHQVVTL